MVNHTTSSGVVEHSDSAATSDFIQNRTGFETNMYMSTKSARFQKETHPVFFSFISFFEVHFVQFYQLRGSTSDTHLKLQYLVKVCKCKRKFVLPYIVIDFF
jgi:hypothetical protein